jgi:hypothetical protein
MSSTRAKKSIISLLAVAVLGIEAAPASSADIICGFYYGFRVCTPIRRTGPVKPTTHPTMVAKAKPSTVKVGESTSLWMGQKRGQNGFTSGEVVRFFDIYKGKTSEITGIRDAIKGGIAHWSREYLSLPGVDQTGIHHLCAMGERSGKIACVKVNVVWGSGTAVDDSYTGVAGDQYKGVATETPPAATVTTTPATPATTATTTPPVTVAPVTTQAPVTTPAPTSSTTSAPFSAPSAGGGGSFAPPVAS